MDKDEEKQFELMGNLIAKLEAENAKYKTLWRDQHALAERLQTALTEAEKALDYIDHELGRPEGLCLPAPVVNASFKAREALAAIRKNRL